MLLAGDAITQGCWCICVMRLHWTHADAASGGGEDSWCEQRADVCHANVNATSVVSACKTSEKRERAAQCRAHTDTTREQ